MEGLTYNSETMDAIGWPNLPNPRKLAELIRDTTAREVAEWACKAVCPACAKGIEHNDGYTVPDNPLTFQCKAAAIREWIARNPSIQEIVNE